MKKVRLLRVQSLECIAEECFVADSFFSRFRGWMMRTEPSPGEALLLRPCREIHMWFMRFAIDVVFLRREGSHSSANMQWVITSVHPQVKAWKILPVRDPRAHDTLELPAGSIKRLALREGEALCIS